jgi:O-antigen ligase
MPVWEECLTYVNRRPLLGYGFFSFWTPDRILRISDEAGWGVPGAHNGYFEIVLSLGIVGGAVYVAILLLAMRRSLQLYRHRRNCFALIMLVEEIATQIPPTLANFIVTTIIVRLGFGYEASRTHLGAHMPDYV